MRLKKGFTLAEILIVLMVIGALATMTIPSLMKGVSEAQYKTAYKKALNAMINLIAMERLSGNVPTRVSDAGASKIYDVLTSSLSVKGYVPVTTIGLNSGETVSASNFQAEKPTTGKVTTEGENGNTETKDDNNARYQNWIISEDNIAYLVTKGGVAAATNCGTKSTLIAAQNGLTAGLGETIAADIKTGTSPESTAQASAACYVIYVDVNGLNAGPNTIADNYIGDTSVISSIANDQFPIYITSDGATPGDQVKTKTGRIASDMK